MTDARAPEPLAQMFAAVPPRYDLVNAVMTLGLDGRWRRAAVAAALVDGPTRVLDLCCGTGDLALALAFAAGPGVQVTGLDFSAPMLARARAKLAAAGAPVELARGTAAALPFPDGAFDALTIGFGLRNLVHENPHAAAHLGEIARVVRPGGRFVAVESGQPAVAAVRGLYHLYLRLYVRGVGTLLSGNGAAYGYLADSAARFMLPAAVCETLRAAGFRAARHRPLLLGSVAVYEATR